MALQSPPSSSYLARQYFAGQGSQPFHGAGQPFSSAALMFLVRVRFSKVDLITFIVLYSIVAAPFLTLILARCY